MAMRDLMQRGRGGGLSSGRGGSLMGPSDMQSPMLSLRREIESLFDDMMRGGLSPFAGSALGRMGGEQRAMQWPNIEITQNENDICIHAEVPGLSENDVELMIEDGVLTIRGEKKTETEDQERGYSERYYGQFERRIALPPDVDEDNAQADFNNGVLSITLHKTQQAERARRIPIGGGMRGQGQTQGMQQAAATGQGQQQGRGQQQGQSQTGQGQTGQGQTGQGQTGQTGQGQAGQGRAGQGQSQSEDQQGEASRPSGQQTQRSPRREPPRQPQE